MRIQIFFYTCEAITEKTLSPQMNLKLGEFYRKVMNIQNKNASSKICLMLALIFWGVL
jgi:hypothetical protein